MSKPKPKDQLQKRGRKSAYRPEIAVTVNLLCKEGLTDQEIVDRLGISIQTLHNWKHQHPEFLDALKSGKSASDERVVRSLFHRAVGYSFDAEEVFQYQGKIVRAKVRKHVPPDTTAMIFWLKNRRKDDWRDVHRLEHAVTDEFAGLSDTELAKELARTAQLLLDDQSGPVIEHEDEETSES